MSIVNNLRIILLHEWDPLEIKDCCGFQDEYDSYADEIFARARDVISEDEIAEYLSTVESESMGLVPDECCNKNVARMVYALIKESAVTDSCID